LNQQDGYTLTIIKVTVTVTICFKYFAQLNWQRFVSDIRLRYHWIICIYFFKGNINGFILITHSLARVHACTHAHMHARTYARAYMY